MEGKLKPSMLRALCLGTVAAITAVAQSAPPPDPNAALEENARRTFSEWQKLSAELEPSLAHLLPCDPKIPSSITETSRASAARLSALSEFLQAEDQTDLRDADAAKRVLASAQAFMAGLADEKTDTAQERAGLDGQIADLAKSLEIRPALGPAQSALQKVLVEMQKRENLVQASLNRRDSLLVALQQLVTALEQREAAVKKVLGAYNNEKALWSAYYAARLGRSEAECSLVKGPAPPAAGRARGRNP